MPLHCHRILLPLLLAVAACNREAATTSAASAKKSPGVPVRVVKVERRDVPLVLEAIGNVEADSSVAVKSRVAGQLKSVQVRDGQEVKEGDILFQIDPAPFAEEVRFAEANIARDLAMESQAASAAARDAALAKNARSQADRWDSLMRQGIVAREKAEEFRSQAEAAEASHASNRAAMESARASRHADESRLAMAKMQLSFTTIRAPISGRAGFVTVKEGNLVKENDTGALVSLLRVRPIFVVFAVPEQSLPDIRAHMAAGSLGVEAAREGVSTIAQGRLASIDNSVDASTGTIKLKAAFPNNDLALWPGQFINVRLRLKMESGLITVPERAVLTGPKGTFAWIVTAEGTADNRPVQVARNYAGSAVITSGLAEGDTVVVEGQVRVNKGTKVEILGTGPTP